MYTLFVYTWSFDSISYLMRFGSWGTKVTNSNPRKTEFLNLYLKKNVENSIKVKRLLDQGLLHIIIEIFAIMIFTSLKLTLFAKELEPFT